MLVEHAAVPVSLLGVRDIGTPLGLGVLHHLVGNVELSVVLEGIDPPVADTVRELLLLAPEDLVGKVGLSARVVRGIERLAKDIFLKPLLGDHLIRGIDVHGNLEELLVQEWNAGLKTPCGSRLVGAQAVGKMEVLDATDALLVESLLVGSSVEVEVSTKDLIAALARENHLDTHGLDLAGKQIHGGRGTDGGDVVGLEVVDNIRQRIKTLLNSEGHDVMLGAEKLGDLERRNVVGGAGETDREGVELGKEGHGRQLVLIVDTDKALALVKVLGCGLRSSRSLLSELPQPQTLALGDRGDQGRVETTGKQNTVGNLGHETFPNGLLEGLTEKLVVDRGLRDL